MNGRVYNPTLARFVSADPLISRPDDTQSYNRYSYVTNRPMFYTDPSGFAEFNSTCGNDPSAPGCSDKAKQEAIDEEVEKGKDKVGETKSPVSSVPDSSNKKVNNSVDKNKNAGGG